MTNSSTLRPPQARMTDRLGDYLAAIRRVHQRTGQCKLRDVQSELGLYSHNTVNRAFQRLLKLGRIRRKGSGNAVYYEPVGVEMKLAYEINELFKEIRRQHAAGNCPEWLREFKGVWE